MIAVEVEYLLGKARASARSDRTLPEWPPHPSRLFSAFVATLHECSLGETAREALIWLQNQGTPSLWADPPYLEEDIKAIPKVWVPVNDDHSGSGSPVKTGIPLYRKRAERYFPFFSPNDPKLFFIWENTDGQENKHSKALSEIAENLSYLGHSSSLVRACIKETGFPSPNLIPSEEGEYLLRVPGPGRMERLETVYEASLGAGYRIEPPLGRFARYAIKTESHPTVNPSLFMVAAVFRKVKGPVLPFEAMGNLVATARNAIMNLIPDPIPELLSGHRQDGSPIEKIHLAIAPIANVGHPHADGHLMGFSVFVPGSLPKDEKEMLEKALDQLQKLWMGKLGEWEITRSESSNPARVPSNLQTRTLTKPSRVWTAATPVIFGHYPKSRPGKTAEAILRRSCSEAGLPEPTIIEWSENSFLKGAPPARNLKNCHKRASGQYLAYVRLHFDNLLKGPVAIGAGRYVGFGFLLPHPGTEGNR